MNIAALVAHSLYEGEKSPPTTSIAADQFVAHRIEAFMTGIEVYLKLSKEEYEKLQRDAEAYFREAFTQGATMNQYGVGGEGIDWQRRQEDPDAV